MISSQLTHDLQYHHTIFKQKILEILEISKVNYFSRGIKSQFCSIATRETSFDFINKY